MRSRINTTMLYPRIKRIILFNLILLLAINSLAFGQLEILSVFPTAQTITADKNSQILIELNQPADTLSVDSKSISVFGRWSGVATGTFHFENNNTQIRFISDKPFSSGEWITVSISAQLKNNNAQNLGHNYAWNFWIQTAATSMNVVETARFSIRQEGESWVQSYGAYAGDLDGDGYSDFAIPNEISNDVRVFLNDGNGNYGNFGIYSIPNGSAPSPNEGADFNGDGMIDLAVGNTRNNILSIFMGDGLGGFLPVKNYQGENGIRGVCVLDVEGDGDVDIVTANRDANNISIFTNDNGDHFDSPIQIEKADHLFHRFR